MIVCSIKVVAEGVCFPNPPRSTYLWGALVGGGAVSTIRLAAKI
jgi:hypothetical protein